MKRKDVVLIEVQKIDDKSRKMLAYLNINSKLSSATLAQAFNQHYRVELDEAMEMLSFLESKDLVKIKTQNDKNAIIIQVTHSGRTYEQDLIDLAIENKKKVRKDRLWNIITMIMSAILTMVINLIMKWGFGI